MHLLLLLEMLQELHDDREGKATDEACNDERKVGPAKEADSGGPAEGTAVASTM